MIVPTIAVKELMALSHLKHEAVPDPMPRVEQMNPPLHGLVMSRLVMREAFLSFTSSPLQMQLRRARAWMPCVDAPNAACPYDIHITVSKDQTAVASGQLLKQTWTAQHRKKFYFSLPQATTASQVAFAVGES